MLKLMQMIIVLFLAQTSFAQTLLYRDKNVDALCVYDALENNKPISLNNCGLHTRPGLIVNKEKNEYMSERGFIGFEYQQKENDYTAHGSSYYKVVGKLQNHYVLLTHNNTGGTGQFMGVVLAKIDGDTLIVTAIDGGDRCNGGVTDAEVKDAKLTYYVNITPGDLLTLAKVQNPGLQAYENLSACAICCLGSAIYQYDPLRKSSTLISIKVDQDALKGLEQGEQQSCFNKLLIEHNKQQNSLNQEQLNEFMRVFYQKCKLNKTN